MLLKACLNGSRRPGEHPALPLTPPELARAAQLVSIAGAGAVHIHPRNAQGAQSLAALDVAAALTAMRERCPGLPIGVSTGLWIEPDVPRRLRLIQQWTVQPDFASVNFSEPGADDLCAALLSHDVGIEAGLWTVADAQRLVQAGLADHCRRILLEPQEQAMQAALATTEAILDVLDANNVQASRLLHADNDALVWPMLDVAFQRGYDTRIGLEDTLTLPDGRLARDNAELVTLALTRARRWGSL